jgi:hypothetical protein
LRIVTDGLLSMLLRRDIAELGTMEVRRGQNPDPYDALRETGAGACINGHTAGGKSVWAEFDRRP